MKRPLTILLLVALSLLPLSGVAEVGLQQSRQQELIYLLHQDCGSCHGMRLTGGLGPALLTAEIRHKPSSYLHQVIAEGVPDTPMPPWQSLLSDADINFLVSYLQNMSPQGTP
jgi:cytochrome c55X